MRIIIAIIIILFVAFAVIGNRDSNRSKSTKQEKNDVTSLGERVATENKIQGHDGINLNPEERDITQLAPPDRRRTPEGLIGKSIDDKKDGSEKVQSDLKGVKAF